jgi:hypothetical protein
MYIEGASDVSEASDRARSPLAISRSRGRRLRRARARPRPGAASGRRRTHGADSLVDAVGRRRAALGRLGRALRSFTRDDSLRGSRSFFCTRTAGCLARSRSPAESATSPSPSLRRSRRGRPVATSAARRRPTSHGTRSASSISPTPSARPRYSPSPTRRRCTCYACCLSASCRRSPYRSPSRCTSWRFDATGRRNSCSR